MFGSGQKSKINKFYEKLFAKGISLYCLTYFKNQGFTNGVKGILEKFQSEGKEKSCRIASDVL